MALGRDRGRFDAREPLILRAFPRDVAKDITIEESLSPSFPGPQFRRGGDGSFPTRISEPLMLAASGTQITGEPFEVELEINPKQAVFSQGREVQKTRTASRGRYVVQDWGPDLMRISLSCQTGNLLPYKEAVAGSSFADAGSLIPGSKFTGPTEDQVINGIDVDGRRIVGLKDLGVLTRPAESSGVLLDFFLGGQARYSPARRVTEYTGKQVKDTFDTRGFLRDRSSLSDGGEVLSYTNLLLLGSRLRTLLRLGYLYDSFDANNHVLFMTLGKSIYRGYMENFTFTIEADRPWMWDFSFDFVVLQGLETLFTDQIETLIPSTLDVLRQQEALTSTELLDPRPADVFDGTIPGREVRDGANIPVPVPFGILVKTHPFGEVTVEDARRVQFVGTLADAIGALFEGDEGDADAIRVAATLGF